VFLPIKTRLLRQELSLATPIDPRINQAFTLKELISAVQDAKNTTPRPDSSCYEMFKHLSTKSLEVMLQLFNKIWFTGNSSVLAAFQCSSSGQAKPTLALTGQYALPAVCANSLKKMVVCRLSWSLEHHKILSISQSGFRQRRKTTITFSVSMTQFRSPWEQTQRFVCIY